MINAAWRESIDRYALIGFLDSFDTILSARSLGIGLWIGLAVITVTLIVLSRTPWGQARPVSKCVVLSVFAHFLLLGYAYGTKLIMTVPVAASMEEVSVELVDDVQPDEPDPEYEGDTNQAPWDEVVGSGGIEPQVDSPDAIAEVSSEADRQALPPSERPEIDGRSMQAVSTDVQPQRPDAAELKAVPFESTHAPIAASEIQRADPTRVQDPRQEVSDLLNLPEHSPTPRFVGEESINSDALATGAGELEFDSSLQRLTEKLVDPDFSYALSGRDRPRPTTSPMIGRVHQSSDETTSGAPSVAANTNQATIRRPASDDTSDGANSLVERLVREPRARLGDGRPVPEPFKLRRADHRLDVALARGGTLESEQAVQRALKWLAENQEPNGRWDSSHHGGGVEGHVLGHDRGGAGAIADTGVTGLALLAFLSAGHTHLEGDYRDVVHEALVYLLSKQGRDGNLSGDATLYARMYCHGMALFAISEAYGMTGDHRLREAVQSGIDYTVAAQHPSSGGWRYQPGDLGDMSQFGWQVMAIRSAALAGITIPAQTENLMNKFLADCTRGAAGGLSGYRPGDQATPTMSAEALVCRLLLEDEVGAATIREAHGKTSEGLPTADNDELLNHYLMYYGTLSMFLAQDASWEAWNQAMQNALLPAQELSGSDAGSWSSDSAWGGYGGRVYTTAMASLCLEVYYRYLPLYNDANSATYTARRE